MDHLERPVADVVAPGHHHVVLERGGLGAQDVDVGVGLVLAGFGPGQRGAGEQPEHPRGIRFRHGKALQTAALQPGCHTAGIVEQLAVRRRTLRCDDGRPLRRVSGGSLEQSDHSVRTAA